MVKANIYEKELFIEGCAISDSVKFDTVQFSFPESWESYEKTVVFSNDAGTQLNVLLNSQNPLCVGKEECYIPHEVLKTPGFSISVFGIKDDSVATTTKKFVKVIESGYALGDEPSEPTMTAYQQIINLSNQALNIAQSVRQDADNGVFNGEKGDAGAPGEASPEFIAMVEQTKENAEKTVLARATLENGTLWVFDGGDANTNSAEIKLILDNEMSDESENAVENKVVKKYIDTVEEKVDSIEQRVDAVEEKVADYIVEQGISGDWNYRKWANGIAECWCKLEVTLKAYSEHSYFYLYNTDIEFPEGLFISVPIPTYLAGVGDYFSTPGSPINLSKDGMRANVLSVINGEYVVTFYIDVKGRWK